MALGCEILFDGEQAKKMQEITERAIGGPCPCKEGRKCPLLPEREPLVLQRIRPVA